MQDPFQKPNFQVPQCSIHNLPGLVINPDVNDTQRPVLCIECLPKHKKVEDQMKENETIFSDIQNKNKRKIDILNLILQLFSQFLNKITQSINKLLRLINDQIDQIKTNQIKQNELAHQSKLISINSILQMNQAQNQQFKEFNKQIAEQLNNIKQSFNIDKLIQGWPQDEQIQNIIADNKKFQYSQVIDSIQQEDCCWAIAVNPNNSIVAAANKNTIRIFEFQNKKLKEIQQLDGHIKEICCLNFMKRSQQLISSCYDGKIIIWELSNNNQWQWIQVLNEHKDGIYCLQINQNEDLIISGSIDKTIIFWKLDQKYWLCNQTLQMEDSVWSLSLNESNNKLIAYVYNLKKIKVIENIRNQWHGTQIIQLSNYSNRICFINDNQFAVQLSISDLLQIFNFDLQDNQFKLGQEIKVKFGESEYNLFPMQYIKSKSILIDKNCQYIKILRKQYNGEFTLIQTIDYGERSLYDCASDDGQFLFTRDDQSKQIQVRKLEMI